MATIILQPRQRRPFAFDRFLMQLVTFASYEKHICQMSLFALPIKLIAIVNAYTAMQLISAAHKMRCCTLRQYIATQSMYGMVVLVMSMNELCVLPFAHALQCERAVTLMTYRNAILSNTILGRAE